MKAEELRIGNWVWEDYGGEYIVSVVAQHSLCLQKPKGLSGSYLYKNVKPIPLTEEWLLKFGFEKNIYDSEETGYGHDYSLCINPSTKLVIEEDFSFGVENSLLDTHWLELDFDFFEGIHHLQNFYFALTNTELTIQ